MSAPTVLLTDFAWPDVAIEARLIEEAGFRLITGPAEPATAEVIAGLAAAHQPAAIMTNWAPVSAAAIAASAPLRIVARLWVGLDNIAVPEATRRATSGSPTFRITASRKCPITQEVVRVLCGEQPRNARNEPQPRPTLRFKTGEANS